MRALILCLLLLVACTPICPQIKETRCVGSVLEMCGSNKRWQRVMDCDKITPISKSAPKQWMCTKTSAGCSCQPRSK